MRTVKTLKPGKDGPKGLLTHSSEGEAERIGCRSPGAQNPRETTSLSSRGAEGFATRRVALRVGWREWDLQRRVKCAGGRWDPDRQVWFLRRDVAKRLDLLPRVVGTGR